MISADAALFPILPFVLIQNVLEAYSLDTQEETDLRQQAEVRRVLQLFIGMPCYIHATGELGYRHHSR